MKAMAYFVTGEYSKAKQYFMEILSSFDLNTNAKIVNQINLVFTLQKLGIANEALRIL